jgi:ankyrin repeat protein
VAAGTDRTGLIVDMLIEKGAQVESQSAAGWTPMHCVAHVGAARSLLAHGAAINAKDRSGRTPLHRVVSRMPAEVTSVVIWPPSSEAVTYPLPRDCALVEFLIAEGADFNARDDSGLTPLHAACSAGALDYVRLLTSHGADLSVKDALGLTALDHAIMAGNAEIADYLVQRGATKTGKALAPQAP